MILGLALAAAAAAVVLAVALLRQRARVSELQALQQMGPLTLSRAAARDPQAGAVHEGWSRVFLELVYSANDVFWESDREHRVTRLLRREGAAAAAGAMPDALIGHALWELPSIGVSKDAWERLRDDMDAGRAFHDVVIGRIDGDGALRFACVAGVPVYAADGAFAGYRGASRDHTAIRQTQVQLEIRDAVTGILAGAARLSEALPAILEAICRPLGWHFGARWMRDARNNTLLCGETWAEPSAAPIAEASRARRFPVSAHDLVSRAWTTQSLAATPDVAQDIDFNRRTAALESGLHAAFAFPVVVQGEVVCVLEFLGPHEQRADDLVASLAQSLGHQLALFWLRREAEARLTYAATHDALTGLRNRLSFNAELDRAIQRAKRNGWRMAVMFVDLDGFKQINDRYGHHAGDVVLIEVARRLKNSLRSSDTLARMGGDEFVVVLEQTGTDGEIAEVAQKLLTAIRVPIAALGQDASVSASFGVAIYPVDAQDQQGLLAHADAAMYRAKAASESRVVFYRPPASELPIYNRSLDVAAAIDAAASALPATDAPRPQ
ncbi:MAG: GGDEF domain-containing protein [Burkholderiales bacterium]|nr:GGDEF domain-containing protein [Burkholderiales bacterium]